MTPEEILRIESDLNIELPDAHCQSVSPFLINALRGNTDWIFWDDADQLILLNKRLRKGEKFLPPWPLRYFALGEDSGGCSDAFDLGNPDYGVF